MGRKKNKSLSGQPKVRDKKSVRSVPAISPDAMKVSWIFSGVDREGPFAWPQHDAEEMHEILTFLETIDSQTWAEVLGRRHHALTDPKGFSKEALKRLSEIHKSDLIDQIYSFAMGSRKRVILIRFEAVAYLLWYDPEHKVYPSTKKHT